MAEPFPLQPRWNRSYSKAREFIKTEGINWLPVDVFEIYKSENWLITTAENGFKIFPEYNWDNFYIKEIDAVTYKKQGYYITIYNERFPNERIRWTLAHEIGHIILGHLTDFEETKIFRSGLTDEKYGVLEQEAHAFASELLTPSVPLMACRMTECNNIQKICLISKEAALKRSATLKKRKESGVPLKEAKFYRNQFFDFLNQRVCLNCHHYFIIPNAKFCPVCGERHIEWGWDKSMIYRSFDLDEKGKARRCPVCDNEELVTNAEYCQICGTHLINKCTGVSRDDDGDFYKGDPCTKVMRGDARFCPYCGAETSFYQSDIFPHWKDEVSKKNNINDSDREKPF